MEDSSPNWYDPEFATFGDRLSAAREAAGMTQEEFAKRLGVKLTSLTKWEDDVAEPRTNRLSMASGILGVSISWLLTGTGEGVDHPEDTQVNGDAQELLADLRNLRAAFTAKSQELGRLEKRLRKMLHEGHLG